MHALYRLQQLWWELSARNLTPQQRDEVNRCLTSLEQSLFQRFTVTDQVHSYRVMRTLQDAGQAHPDLLTAALLHDVGKTRVSLTAWDRSLAVLAHALVPALARRWGVSAESDPNRFGWRKGFIVKAHHPIWGAGMAAAAGSTPQSVALIQRHQDPIGNPTSETDRLLQCLQWADDQH